jgi:hypothetical protein
MHRLLIMRLSTTRVPHVLWDPRNKKEQRLSVGRGNHRTLGASIRLLAPQSKFRLGCLPEPSSRLLFFHCDVIVFGNTLLLAPWPFQYMLEQLRTSSALQHMSRALQHKSLALLLPLSRLALLHKSLAPQHT